MDMLTFLIFIVFPIFIAIGGSLLAKRKHRNGILWFFSCLFTGLMGLLVLACSSSLDYDDELDISETDVLGYFMVIIGIIWFGVTCYYGSEAVNAYNEQMRWNMLMQFMNY